MALPLLCHTRCLTTNLSSIFLDGGSLITSDWLFYCSKFIISFLKSNHRILYLHMPQIYPQPLPPKGCIGLIAPSSGTKESDLEEGIAYLVQQGYRVKTAGNVTTRTHFLAGGSQTRLQETAALFNDDEVDAVFAARGGWGANHLLPDLLEQLDGSSPKPFVGYSDITVLQLALYKEFGWVTFSGPMVTTEFGQKKISADAENHFWDLLTQPPVVWDLNPSSNWGLDIWKEGNAKGLLLGGCLTLVCSLLGTPHFPDMNDAVLVIEETEEKPRTIDRMLHQLRLAGVFDQISGMIVGQFIDCFPENPSENFTLRELVVEATAGYNFPILANYPYGHNLRDFLTLPIGSTIQMTTSPPQLSLVT